MYYKNNVYYNDIICIIILNYFIGLEILVMLVWLGVFESDNEKVKNNYILCNEKCKLVNLFLIYFFLLRIFIYFYCFFGIWSVCINV